MLQQESKRLKKIRRDIVSNLLYVNLNERIMYIRLLAAGIQTRSNDYVKNKCIFNFDFRLSFNRTESILV